MPVQRNDETDPVTYDYTCPLKDSGVCEFTSTQWEKKKDAVARGGEHEEEHSSGEPMRELADFMADVEG